MCKPENLSRKVLLKASRAQKTFGCFFCVYVGGWSGCEGVGACGLISRTRTWSGGGGGVCIKTFDLCLLNKCQNAAQILRIVSIFSVATSAKMRTNFRIF